MTPQRQKVYDFIVDYHKKHGVVPSTIKTANHIGVTKQAIGIHYQALARLGYIKKLPIQVHYELTPELSTV
jgi:predicted transcriptional regulator